MTFKFLMNEEERKQDDYFSINSSVYKNKVHSGSELVLSMDIFQLQI